MPRFLHFFRALQESFGTPIGYRSERLLVGVPVLKPVLVEKDISTFAKLTLRRVKIHVACLLTLVGPAPG